jgi:hypothetical protein
MSEKRDIAADREAATPNEVWEMSEERIQVWHFIRADHTTSEGLLKVEVGQTLTVEGPLELCKHGLHGSRKALDALRYAPGPVACKDEIWGDIIEDNDKLCGRYRKCLAMIDATYILHEFACLCAERALTRRREAGMEPDPRSWAAIDAKRKWLRGEIGGTELAAAGDAAGDAAWDAAWAAAGDAAGAAARAAAGDAAWAAAGDAAGAAARAAARAAAWDAAWAAARDAAWDAARDAEMDWQNAELTRMLEEEIRRGRA